MGRSPEEQLQRRAMAPHERFCLEAGRRTTIMKNFSLFFIQRGGGFVFPLAIDLSPSHQAPLLPRVIVWAPRVQSGPFKSRSVCADTM
ncbi:hypothetical protein GOODEAATRI_005707 [Goodea atripinnis]|uniref:Uncharacterized protein n=1 Tax=Goodea atripinnis TaxID=208336 RepID=A0ABV0MFE8_9TELE